jgi:hypothetical protein
VNNIYNIIFLILALPLGVNICTCPPPTNWRKATPIEFEYSEFVFIGDVTICDDESYEIVICEVFKGNLKAGQFIKGKNIGTCGPYVDENGEWVLFGEYSTDFKTNDCGLSSSIADPFGLTVPPPPKPNSDIDRKKQINKWKVESKKNILEQIKMLRNISE